MKDENWDVAVFSSLSSSPSRMEASKAADHYGLFHGHDTETSDALQAYPQAKLGGTRTWVRLPKDRWPAKWVKEDRRDPVVPLDLALYGHPDAGGYWELKCNGHFVKVGFEPITDWRSCYFHPKLRLFLVIYVDDFKLSGPPGCACQGLGTYWFWP